jgi:excinuclease ABC subunit C
MTVSVLDEIEGIGPKRKKAIMSHFGSMKRLRSASVDDIASVKGVSRSLAEDIYQELRDWDEQREAVSSLIAEEESERG